MKTDILTIFVPNPAPTDGVLNTEFNTHVAFVSTTGKVVLVFWSNICIWMEWLRVHLDKIGHTNNPMLWKVTKRGEGENAALVLPGKRTCPSELFGRGILGIETEASRRCSIIGLGSSSSSYSKACLLFRSGEDKPSSGGGGEMGEE